MSTSRTTLSISLPGSRARWVAVGLATGLIVAVIAWPALAPRQILATDPATAAEHTISVAGTGRVIITPDIADLRLGVTVAAKTVKEARSANATAMTAVIESLKKLGIADKDIQTTVLSLSPTYDYSTNTNPPALTGYTMSNGLAIIVRNLDKIGDAVDGALEAGATSLDGISFRVEDQAAAELQARLAAMTEAKSKAQTLASAAGVSIVGVASISENVSPGPYPIYYGYAAAERDTATPIQPGSNEIAVTVAVIYVID